MITCCLTLFHSDASFCVSQLIAIPEPVLIKRNFLTGERNLLKKGEYFSTGNKSSSTVDYISHTYYLLTNLNSHLKTFDGAE